MSELAASPEYGYDGVAYRAMRLPPELVGKYKVHQDSKLNLFSWPGFTSCTRDAETCLGFVDDWDLNVVFAIRSGGCRLRPMRIEEWSQHPESLRCCTISASSLRSRRSTARRRVVRRSCLGSRRQGQVAAVSARWW